MYYLCKYAKNFSCLLEKSFFLNVKTFYLNLDIPPSSKNPVQWATRNTINRKKKKTYSFNKFNQLMRLDNLYAVLNIRKY